MNVPSESYTSWAYMCEGIHKHTRVERLIKCPTGLDTLEYLCPKCGRLHKLFVTNVDSLLSLRVNNFVSVWIISVWNRRRFVTLLAIYL